MVLIIISFFVVSLLIGIIKIQIRINKHNEEIRFTSEYRNNFMEFANLYSKDQQNFDGEKYFWLTKHVNKLQSNLGFTGMMDYIAPFKTHMIKNYQIVLNTLPKFREGTIDNFDLNSVDDCLIRYLGDLDDLLKAYLKKRQNPIMWFQEGIKELFGFPLLIMSWFGILSNRSVYRVKENLLYRVITGIIGLVAFLAGIVTIIQGKEQTIEFIQSLINGQ